MEVSLKKEHLEILREGFFSEYFDPGNDENSEWQNYQTAVSLFHQFYWKVSDYADRISYGEIIDPTELELSIQGFLFSEYFLKKFRGEDFVNPSTIDLSNDKTENAINGNKYLGAYAISKSKDDFEVGKWFMYNAIN